MCTFSFLLVCCSVVLVWLNNHNENKKEVTWFVATHWRPRDLHVFDKLARSDDSLVRASVTERACALSHISRRK